MVNYNGQLRMVNYELRSDYACHLTGDKHLSVTANHSLNSVVSQNMKSRFTLVIILATVLTFTGCSNQNDPEHFDDRAQAIVDNAIRAMGGTLLEHAEVSFRFRDRDYIYKNKKGTFEHTRIHIDSAGVRTVDVYHNNGLDRTVNGESAKLDKTWQTRYSNSINSVIYFTFLPYRLNDPAVIKTYRDIVTIKGKPYHEILVQFRKEGGGKDHDDNFLYWFDTATYAMDYLAYDYVTDGGGVRFREAYNRRSHNGLTVQDYVNYKPSDDSLTLYHMRTAYEQGKLVELSRIELHDVDVQNLNAEI